ncbi:hypothetical protein N0V88_005677 [Collariella sp. IMI 366227]|nr:hypothetical protein N0V88_005677 [Collariella sp. IMI 366227]
MSYTVAGRGVAATGMRLNRPAAVTVRLYSRTDALSTNNGSSLALGPSPDDSPSSVTNAAGQPENSLKDLELPIPTAPFEPIDSETAARRAEKSNAKHKPKLKSKRPKSSIEDAPGMVDPNDPFSQVLAAYTQAEQAAKEQQLEAPADVFVAIDPEAQARENEPKAHYEKDNSKGSLWVRDPKNVAAAAKVLQDVVKAMQSVQEALKAQQPVENLTDLLAEVAEAAAQAKYIYEDLDYSDREIQTVEDEPACDLKSKLQARRRLEYRLRDGLKKVEKVKDLAIVVMERVFKEKASLDKKSTTELSEYTPVTSKARARALHTKKKNETALLGAGREFLESMPRLELAMREMEQPPRSDEDGQGDLDDQHRYPVLELPTDQAKLKALPRGFYDMTDFEQQEELWIVGVEDRLGREWELPDPGKHTAYIHDYPPYSPSKIIGMLHRWRNRTWTPHQWEMARAIAGNRSLRFPVLTAQAFLRRHMLLARRRGVALKMERYLGGTKEWKTRLAKVEGELGVTEADIKQWLWILSPRSGDMQVHRFLRSDCRKPLFLLHLILAKDRQIREPMNFLELIQYIRENYILADRPQEELNHPRYKGQGRSMSWWHYLVFLYRLVWHCREAWPAAMPVLARLTAEYIGVMRLETKARALTGYQARSLLLNKALQYFSWPARIRPIDHMEHNWAAQRHLLRLAATAEPPLVMDKNGYRGVRAVLVALEKTKGEARNADRIAQTWPPYRRPFDGIDERRDPEDDLSRSAKAGMLVRAAGYSDDIVDRALGALGGSTFGQAPTIQTRSPPPRFYSGQRSSQNILSEWAAQVRATRNAREAWIVFQNPPESGIRPSAPVYAEMFEKLYAREVIKSSVVRPGDAKEVFPVYDVNLTEFEIARLTPPRPAELYDTMLQDKVMPTMHCLVVLIRNAPSKTAALQYLNDSPFKEHVQVLSEPISQSSIESQKRLASLPLHIFNAWIGLLCRLHTREFRKDSLISEAPTPKSSAENADSDPDFIRARAEDEQRARDASRGGSILEAIELTTRFQRYNGRAANHDKAPWHTILKALAGPKMLYSRLGAEFNNPETLMTFLQIYERTAISKGTDPVAFEALCVMIRKTLKLATFKGEGGKMVPRPFIAAHKLLEKLLAKAHRLAVRHFEELARPLGGPEQPQPRQPLHNEPEARDEFDIDDFEPETASTETTSPPPPIIPRNP